jgi:hypothetical protein
VARTVTAWLLAPVCLLQIGLAQEAGTRAEQIQQWRAELAKQPLERDDDAVERGIEWAHEHKLTTAFSYGWKGITPTIGGLVNEQGFALGAQFLRRDLLNGKLVARASARGSLQSAYHIDGEVGLPQLARNRAFLDFYVRHRNSPRISFYGIGPNSTDSVRTSYLQEDTTVDLTFGVKPTRWLWFGATGGYLGVNTGPGNRDEDPSIEEVYTPRRVPGIDHQSDFFRGGVFAYVDGRDNPYGPRSGGQYYGRFDYYDDRNNTAFTFRRFTAEAQQFVPLFNKKRVIALRAKTIFSYPNSGQEVPFYLQPTLGSADDLRGFAPFRYLDRNSLTLNAEWRWEIMSYLEGAVFADAGKVAPRAGLINFKSLQKSYGGGLRFRAPGTNAMIFRFDVAGSREGIQVWFVFNDLFATPRIRTGRELSPPAGRLP